MSRASIPLILSTILFVACSNSLQSNTPLSKVDTLNFSSLRIGCTLSNAALLATNSMSASQDTLVKTLNLNESLYSKQKQVLLGDTVIAIVFDSSANSVKFDQASAADSMIIDPSAHVIRKISHYFAGYSYLALSETVNFTLENIPYAIDSTGALISVGAAIKPALTIYHYHSRYEVHPTDDLYIDTVLVKRSDSVSVNIWMGK